jgi:hypothetical protein
MPSCPKFGPVKKSKKSLEFTKVHISSGNLHTVPTLGFSRAPSYTGGNTTHITHICNSFVTTYFHV